MLDKMVSNVFKLENMISSLKTLEKHVFEHVFKIEISLFKHVFRY